MKPYKAMTLLLSALLLTACADSQSSQPDTPADPAQTTAVETSAETTAPETTAAALSAETAAVTTALTAQTTGSTASAAQTAPKAENTTAVAAATTVSAAETAAKQAFTTSAVRPGSRPTVAILKEKALPAEAQKALDSFFEGIRKNDRALVEQSSNIGNYIRFCSYIDGADEEQEREEMYADLDIEFEMHQDFTAERPDLVSMYNNELLPKLEEELDHRTDNETLTKAQCNEIRRMMQGVTEFWSAELTITEKDSDPATVGIPLIFQNGKWLVDVLFFHVGDLPVSRESANTYAVKKTQTLFRFFSAGLADMEDKGIETAGLQNQDFTWKKDKLRVEGSADSADPMLRLRNYVCQCYNSYYRNGTDGLLEIRFRLEDGVCLAVAAALDDGRYIGYPASEYPESYASLDDAFAAAKEAAAQNKTETIKD